ncbi:MAG: type II toxin-antitoxin system VapC family toxin [Candidatus Bathyarchaeia archaeon]
MSSKEAEDKHLIDSDVFISYIKADNLIDHSESVVNQILEGEIRAYVSSMLYEDVTTGLRSKGLPITEVAQVILSIASIEHTPLPLTPAVTYNALMLYKKYGGSRKLGYFDAYHVATAKIHDLPLVTSDNYINKNRMELGLTAIDLRSI